MRALAYARVSTEEQAESGLDAQPASAHSAICDRGWALAGSVIDAGVSGSVPPDRRDALGPALEALDAGDVGRPGGGPPRPDHPEPAGVG